MKNSLLFLVLFVFQLSLYAQQKDFTTEFEKSKGKATATYDQTIAYYKKLEAEYPSIKVVEKGITDSGKNLHLILLSPDRKFDIEKLRDTKRILFINNGIHPGEPDGIDATMMLYRDIVQGKIDTPKHTVLATIPIYNIGGSLNRNSTSRTNQNGPLEYGFRGNAKNYDLNRDFIKNDTKNARAFAEIYHFLKPDVFIDNHVSNGADYQYVLTHLFTQHNKLGGEAGTYLHNRLVPDLITSLNKKDLDITPYVNVFNAVPEKGFSQFFDSPRYSTGYTTLWNSLGMMVETHMLKPYDKRVHGTYELMKSMIDIIEKEHRKIKEVREATNSTFLNAKTYPIQWEVDKSKSTTLDFKGYEGEQITSEVTGLSRLKYDRNKPFTKKVTYSNYFKPTKRVKIPEAYLIPKAWNKIIKLLKLNKVALSSPERDQKYTVEVYHIANFETRGNPYEGHYLHKNTEITTSTEEITVNPDDFYLVKTRQSSIRYILETLEPEAVDSFFNWNFFDTILQQKEGFSPYVWEDKALEFLNENPSLKTEFENKKDQDSTFAKNWYAQLDWIHKRSPNYEKAHLRYPIYRILEL
ncbi:M14 family metallopeptidase [Galbibacter sp. EGI 63066]|uniref:M14 family metallopeptidase n=1 Tax=Galbibacter sp. EGI 63066 TaxID=2993559 RepID=UPI002248E318|nr:M14 family metallopeptidase [Galbibacter sp. EGI 63066]MCX2679676.1 M14 family metallopeptidase [Galbibacter sp. EGI 63066]